MDGSSAPITVKSLLDLDFINRFTRDLPADPETTTRPREVTGALYSRVSPTAVAAPRLVAGSPECAALIGLDPAELESEEFAGVFGGNALIPGMDPFAMAYGGHQFGHWAGQLGDGRAINLGEVRGPGGEGWTLQLKGAGMTPYSRRADGLAVLRSSVREFLCSEAMHHLGAPPPAPSAWSPRGPGHAGHVLRRERCWSRARSSAGCPPFVRFGS